MSIPSVAHGPQPGRVALLAACVGYAVFLVGAAFLAPEVIPGRGRGGQDAPMSKAAFLALAAGSGVLIAAVCALAPRTPQRWAGLVNMPHRQYWARPENWPTAQRLLADLLGWMGAAILAYLGIVFGLLIADADGAGPPAWVVGVTTAGLLVVVLGCAAWAYVSPTWRPRPTQDAAH